MNGSKSTEGGRSAGAADSTCGDGITNENASLLGARLSPPVLSSTSSPSYRNVLTSNVPPGQPSTRLSHSTTEWLSAPGPVPFACWSADTTSTDVAGSIPAAAVMQYTPGSGWLTPVTLRALVRAPSGPTRPYAPRASVEKSPLVSVPSTTSAVCTALSSLRSLLLTLLSTMCLDLTLLFPNVAATAEPPRATNSAAAANTCALVMRDLILRITWIPSLIVFELPAAPALALLSPAFTPATRPPPAGFRFGRQDSRPSPLRSSHA
jgi:hypothetical protein